MIQFFADLHIHVGINELGRWVKIPTSRHLTVRNIFEEAATRKGMQVIGIVDAISPLVLHDLNVLLEEGCLKELPGGGYSYNGELTVLLGAEIETAEEQGGLAHTLIFLPDLSTMTHFSTYMSQHIRNIHISSQNSHMPLRNLISIASGYQAAIIPAHVFTPYKSVFGNCTNRLANILTEKELTKVTAIELGLSADTFMADRISELSEFTFLSNSDAHSLEKVAREYNIITAPTADYNNFLNAVNRKNGCKVYANYGLNPRLGKYHLTSCRSCGKALNENSQAGLCPICGGKLTRGVAERINQIADRKQPVHPEHRPPYFYQIPLEFIPGLGKKSFNKLLDRFKTEMQILHYVPFEDLSGVVGTGIATSIIENRNGQTKIVGGGGGIYGRLAKK